MKAIAALLMFGVGMISSTGLGNTPDPAQNSETVFSLSKDMGSLTECVTLFVEDYALAFSPSANCPVLAGVEPAGTKVPAVESKAMVLAEVKPEAIPYTDVGKLLSGFQIKAYNIHGVPIDKRYSELPRGLYLVRLWTHNGAVFDARVYKE